MLKKLFSVILFFIVSFNLIAQEDLFNEKPPVFPDCATITNDSLQNCFDTQIFKHVFNNFKVPDVVTEKNYRGEVVILFEVNKEGEFRVIYVDAMYNELKDEARRVFDELPKIEPATYNGNPTFKQYSMPIRIPLVDQSVQTKDLSEDEEIAELERAAKTEYDSVNKSLKPFSNREYTSQLNIPFTHSYYAQFERSVNLVGTNSHTASKPFIYEDIAKYYDFEAEKRALMKDKSSFAGRKLWNERLVRVEGKGYWFVMDPIFDFEVGVDTEAEFSNTYNNTRGINIQGGLGKRFSFYTSFFESQGRFPEYYNQYAESIKAADEAAIIPGRGIAKAFKDNGYDYPVAEAYLSYSPTNFLNIQFGHGKNFIGDGYRSLFISDAATPYPFLKLNASFWKIKYTSTWTWLRDVRREVEEDGAYLPKYMATHYLSWNVSKRLNVGLFESVIWNNANNRGFDVNYLNPIIFFRAIEFETGQDAGNALLGLSSKFKLNDNMNVYGQLIVDEFAIDDVTGGNKSWRNKFGYQLGFKYYNAFKLKNLMLQLEYNRVRPYTYSHDTVVLNYGHSNQSMAHLWGSNFSELVIIGRYHYKRWFGNAQLIVGERGLDFNDGTDNFSYGGDIYRNYNERPFDTGVTVGQGNNTTSLFANLQAGYLINPATNLKLFADVTFRDFNPDVETGSTTNSNTVWFNIGIRTDLFNWYFDL